ncbi:MAG: transposase [Chloroflexi bacterium]|nr:transposase [Chloroflexota bacterium]
MSDNHQRYRSIRASLSQMLSNEPKGYNAKQLNILAGLVSGIVGSRRTNYPQIASKAPDRTKPESRVKRISRFVNETDAEQEVHVMPFAGLLLSNLVERTLVLVMDSSEVGRGCLALMLSVIYRGRALPIAWLVISAKKGHFSQERHIKLLSAIQELLPPEADVVFLGDGEFDGAELQAELTDFGWKYACRTSNNIILFDGEEFSFQDLPLQPDMCLSLPDVLFTRQRFGPVLAIAWWRKGYKGPVYLISNFELAEEACYWYQKRFKIETFFSDQKGRGFHLHKSHLSNPARLAKLMLAACLAYLWLVYLGVWTIQQKLHTVIHRTDRCDLSLFQLGLRVIDHLLDHNLPLPVSFTNFSHAYPLFVR